jgi:hypothetical protein
MRNLLSVVSVCLIVTIAALPALTASAAGNGPKVTLLYKGELPELVNGSVGKAMKPADGESFEVIGTAKVKMYNAGWVRLLDKAKKKAAAQGGDCIVVTSWGFDPNKASSVKTTERVKTIEFEVARMKG